jgi:hypothetical protein
MGGLIILFFLFLPLSSLHAEEPPLSRLEGFLLLWEPLKRPAEGVEEEPYSDVPGNYPASALLTFAKARGILPPEGQFYPEEPLRLNDALLWLFRSRNVAKVEEITYDTLPSLIERSALLSDPQRAFEENPLITRGELQGFSAHLDAFLREEGHTVSYYGEEFAGGHTAFGEIYDPSALTAAHRTLPYNTLVRVTYSDGVNCQRSTVNCPTRSVVVRINDRGPYRPGRDMDLSRAAFERLAPLQRGLLTEVTFERLGSAAFVMVCPEARYQRRLGPLVLHPGIPRIVPVGTTLRLSADGSFRVLLLRPPGGPAERPRWWLRRGESIEIPFEREGTFLLILHEDGGRRRRFQTRVIGACA